MRTPNPLLLSIRENQSHQSGVSPAFCLQVLSSDSLPSTGDSGVKVIRGPGAVGLAPVVDKDTDSERSNTTTEGEEGDEVHVETESVLGHSY